MEDISPGQIFSPYVVVAMRDDSTIDLAEALCTHFEIQVPQGQEVQLLKAVNDYYSRHNPYSQYNIANWRSKSPSLVLSKWFRERSLDAYFIRDSLTESVAALTFHTLAVTQSASDSLAEHASICLPKKLPDSLEEFMGEHHQLQRRLVWLSGHLIDVQDLLLAYLHGLLNPAGLRLGDELPPVRSELTETFELPAIKPSSGKSIGLHD
jgi:hypothetical protein